MPIHLGRRAAMTAALSLAACSSEVRRHRPAEMRANYSYDPSRGDAVLLGSLETFAAYPNLAASVLLQQPRLIFMGIMRVVETGDRVEPSAPQQRGYNVTGGSSAEEYADKVSGLDSSTVLFCFVASPARYRISGIKLWTAGGTIYDSSRTTEFPPIEFTAEAGVARYIGNFAFGYRSQLRVSHIALRDRAERDLQRLRNEVPWLASVNPVIDIPRPAGFPAEFPAEIT
ncbi:hypothetical protein NON00_24010 [Roseomonas sp. GC11]|uniref:hypothetical protein n=1 Tax=Roseomonas sp. GC11 TaxID=2950546 RepID=UPI00210EFC2F|nr:hypothetical protein [Roseomonas sp. GC11]MCQ4162966.1 hypothetical protein [Roseomonas sp. GC11]